LKKRSRELHLATRRKKKKEGTMGAGVGRRRGLPKEGARASLEEKLGKTERGLISGCVEELSRRKEGRKKHGELNNACKQARRKVGMEGASSYFEAGAVMPSM